MARRVTGNVTLRSVLFQNALRTALGLTAARLVAGYLGLAHGFWVLLAVLTFGRTTAGETWQAVRRAVAGNAVGALAAGALLIGLGRHTDVYAALLAPAMLAGFALGPLLGLAYTQVLFTLVVATAFAQISPATGRLSEARVIDVVTGSVIGLLCGLLAWPAGAGREIHRAMARLLRSCGPLLPQTEEELLYPSPGACASPQTLPSVHLLRLAEAAYAQYRGESPSAQGRGGADWHAVLISANHIILGAHWLPRFGLRPHADPSGPTTERAMSTAADLVAEANRIAALLTGARPQSAPPPVPAPSGVPEAPLPIDLEVWMTSLAHRFRRIEASMTPLPGYRNAGAMTGG
jgi:uncharacterized membrane protein YccC